jgi:hypothetical protein
VTPEEEAALRAELKVSEEVRLAQAAHIVQLVEKETYMPSVKTVHKAIKNYLINELGVTMTYVENLTKLVIKETLDRWFNGQLHDEASFLRQQIRATAAKHTQDYLQRNLSVAIAKAELKAEIVIVDGRMDGDT